MKRIYIIATLIGGIIAVCACVQDSLKTFSVSEDNGGEYLSVLEAKDFFERQVLVTTRVNHWDEGYALNPGDFTPLWDEAFALHNNQVANVDIPILGQNRYKVLRSEIIGGQAKACKVDVTQKLVVTKSTKTGKMLQYLMTFVPNQHYYNKNKGNISNKVMSLDLEYFSGLVIYSLPQINYPFKVEKYEAGKKTLGVIIPKKKGESQPTSFELENFFGCVKVCKIRSVQTRSYEDYDDFFDWFENEIWDNADDGDHFTMENDGDNWWLEDQDGNHYDVPDNLVDNNEDNGEESDWNDNANESSDDMDSDIPKFGPDIKVQPDPNHDEGSELMVWFQVYHKPCNTYLGIIDVSAPGTEIFYCRICKVYVTVHY